MKLQWFSGHHVELLENGEEYFPAVFDAIRGARREVIVETFILFEDKVGRDLQACLIEAAQRGVRVDLLVDGFGTAELSDTFIGEMASAGVVVRSFDPGTRLFGQRLNIWRRMHRKLVVVDARCAFVGGINFSADHLLDFGPEAKQDYAVRLEGEIVHAIRAFAVGAIEQQHADDGRPGRAPNEPAPERMREPDAAHPQSAPGLRGAGMARDPAVSRRALFVTRDNHHHRNDIERHYRLAIRGAKKTVVIANAYFFPGWRLMRQLRRAAKRGVQVKLILQGEPDMPIVKTAASLLYGFLQRDGVEIHEYCTRPLHGKVAVVDAAWATVGSSNLDPTSLALNLEANVVLLDEPFAQMLHDRLLTLAEHDCKLAPTPPKPRWAWLQQWRSTLIFHVLRRFPAWARQLPAHAPRLVVRSLDDVAAPQGSAADAPGPREASHAG